MTDETNVPVPATNWPPTNPEHVPATEMNRPSLARRRIGGSVGVGEGGIPGVLFTDWLARAREDRTGPDSSIVVTVGGLPPEIAKALVAKAAECVRGVELLDKLTSSASAIDEICKRTGIDADAAHRMLRMKRDDLVRRGTAMRQALDAPIGFSLLIEVNGDRYSVG